MCKCETKTGTRRQCVAAATALLSILSSATCFGWVTPILVDLLGPDSEVPMTEVESSWMISLIEIGNLLSPILAGYLADRWGRKPCILATGPLYILSWVIVLRSSTVEALYVVRVMQGAIMGCVLTVVPVYLAEIASPSIRGSILCSSYIAWFFGYLFEYCVGPFVPYRAFTAITAVWPVLLTLLFPWQPESPYYLVMRKRNVEAKSSLSVLRQLPVTSEEVLKEFEEIATTLKNKEETSWNDLIKSRSNRRNLCVVFFVGFVAMLSGGYALMSYSSHIFTSTNITFVHPDHITIFLGGFLLITSVFSSIFVDRLGRRPLLLISSTGCTISLLSSTAYFRFNSDTSQHGWMLVLSMLSYFIFWSFGLVPVYFTYQSELFSSTSRGAASSIIAFVITIYAFINLKFYFPITENLGFSTLFGFYSVVCLTGIIGIYLIAPETKGKSLLEIQKVPANRK